MSGYGLSTAEAMNDYVSRGDNILVAGTAAVLYSQHLVGELVGRFYISAPSELLPHRIRC